MKSQGSKMSSRARLRRVATILAWFGLVLSLSVSVAPQEVSPFPANARTRVSGVDRYGALVLLGPNLTDQLNTEVSLVNLIQGNAEFLLVMFSSADASSYPVLPAGRGIRVGDTLGVTGVELKSTTYWERSLGKDVRVPSASTWQTWVTEGNTPLRLVFASTRRPRTFGKNRETESNSALVDRRKPFLFTAAAL
jgi:hypothetical protein